MTILEFYSDVKDCTSWWRGRGAFAMLSKYHGVNIMEAPYNVDWDVIMCADIAFFQRPTHHRCFNTVALCKEYGLKVWLDFDDSFILPKHHPVYEYHTQSFDEATFARMIKLADIVTVSTEYLKTLFSQFTDKIVVVPNAINDYILKPSVKSRNKTILWRGGDHHLEDLYTYSDVIIEVMNAHPDWKFITMGSDPIFLKNKLKNYEYGGDYSFREYFAYIKQNNPAILIVPLLDNELNRGKSNISWQEGTYAGAACIVPNYMDVPAECAVKYEDVYDFASKLELLMLAGRSRIQFYNESVKYIQSKLLLSEINEMRLSIINTLTY